MRRLLKIVAAAVGVIVLVAGLTVWSLYNQATASVPAYDAVVEVAPEAAESERAEFESQLSALYSDTQSLDAWSSRVTADQINAWLATRLATDFPAVARAGFRQPRVMIDAESVTVAVRSKIGKIDGVLSVAVRPYVTAEGELAIDIQSAKMGRLTLPMEGVAAKVRDARLERFAPVRWSQTESRSVLLLDLDRVADTSERDLRLTGVDLRDGELLIRGESEPLVAEDAEQPAAHGEAAAPEPADASG